MSTRSVIARVTGTEGAFKGVYHHWDGYPTWLGHALWKMLHDQFNGNLSAMLQFVIDDHSAGWSRLDDECYCHPKRERDAEPAGNWFTNENVEGSGLEWVYAFEEEANRLYVRDQNHKEDAGIVELGEAEPDWGKIECGENLERCGHYAWKHFPELAGCRLGTQTYLGKRPLEFHDTVAFLVAGRRYVSTGCGGNSDYLNGHGKRFPRNVWVATVKTANGRRVDIPVAVVTAEGYRPYPGVVWVYPPTKDNPHETTVEPGHSSD